MMEDWEDEQYCPNCGDAHSGPCENEGWREEDYCEICNQHWDFCICEEEPSDDFPMYLEYDDWKDDFRDSIQREEDW